MILRTVASMTLIMVLFSAKFALADFYDDCKQDCGTAQTQCVEGITLYDEEGVKEAREACAGEQRQCIERCHADDAKVSEEATQRAIQQAAEEAEKRLKEQQETLNGEIKVLKFE